jgi:hypothetical protein
MQVNINQLLLFSKLHPFCTKDLEELLKKTETFPVLYQDYKDLIPFISPTFEIQSVSTLRADEDSDDVGSALVYKTPYTF